MGWKDDINYGLAAFGLQIPEKLPIDAWVGKLTGSPARNTSAVVLASAAIFYAVERDHNPKVNDIYDAMVLLLDLPERRIRRYFCSHPGGENSRQLFNDDRSPPCQAASWTAKRPSKPIACRMRCSGLCSRFWIDYRLTRIELFES